MKLSKIIELIKPTEVINQVESEIVGINKIEYALVNEISFLHNPKYFSQIATTKSNFVIVPENFEVESTKTLLKCKDPYKAFLIILKAFNPLERVVTGLAKSAVISDSAKIGEQVGLGENTVIGENVLIGENSQIAANVTIYKNVKIGKNVIIHSNCVIRENCMIGDGVILQNGCIIGSDGFGFAPGNNAFEKIPQVGNVILEDNVEIGANTVIDRATMGSTIVKKGTKLDNLIQVGHNVEIGANTVIAAQTGVSGSSKIGANCMIGGQVGLVGHIKLEDEVKVGAQAGISRSVKKGALITGTPARDLNQQRRIDASISKLPELLRRVKELEKILKEK